MDVLEQDYKWNSYDHNSCKDLGSVACRRRTIDSVVDILVSNPVTPTLKLKPWLHFGFGAFENKQRANIYLMQSCFQWSS